MADNGRWFKLWVDSLIDQDLFDLDIADFGRWAKFGAYMKAHGECGVITISPPARTLQVMFQIDSFEAVISCIKRFPNCKIESSAGAENSNGKITVTFLNWRKYQEDSTVAKRQQAFRDRHRNGLRGEEKRGEEKRREKTNTLCAGFEVFWEAYPKKKSKVAAEKSWARIRPSEQLLATMIAKIKQAKTSAEWQKGNGQFVPHPASWLNGKRWEDEDEKGGAVGANQSPAQVARTKTGGVLAAGGYDACIRRFDENPGGDSGGSVPEGL